MRDQRCADAKLNQQEGKYATGRADERGEAGKQTSPGEDAAKFAELSAKVGDGVSG